MVRGFSKLLIGGLLIAKLAVPAYSVTKSYVIDVWNVFTNDKAKTDITTDYLNKKGWNASTIGIYWKEDHKTVYHTLVSTATQLSKEGLYKKLMNECDKPWGASVREKGVYDSINQIKKNLVELVTAVSNKDFQKQITFYDNELINLQDGKRQRVNQNVLSKLKVVKSTCNLEDEMQLVSVSESEYLKQDLKLNNVKTFIPQEKDYCAEVKFSSKSGMNNFSCIIRKIDNKWKIISVFEKKDSTYKLFPAFEEK
jgi:hypothetical protein